MFITKFLPKIEIHCWGGLGSQLFAVVLRLELEAQYPSRKFIIVCHDNGVTQRSSEISLFFPGSVVSVKDYAYSNPNEVGSRHSKAVNGKQILRNLIVSLLRLSSIIVDGDRKLGLAKIRLWTLQVRGHYSERHLDRFALNQVRSMISHAIQVRDFDSGSHKLFVHYRLGDLLTLQEKSPISSERILRIIQDVHSRVGSRIKLFSDTPDAAINLLAVGKFPVDVARDYNGLATLWILVNSQYFIGTNSKISLWAVILNGESTFRVESYLPYELQHHIVANIGGVQNLKFY